MNEQLPEFKKVDAVIDGEYVEKFFINQQEVTSEVYYKLLEDRIVTNQPTKEDIQIENSVDLPNEKEVEFNEYVNSLVFLIRDNEDKMFDILLDELTYQYKSGFLDGQLLLNNSYAKAFRQNNRLLQNKIFDLQDEYDKDT
jgi:hypothetical protein